MYRKVPWYGLRLEGMKHAHSLLTAANFLLAVCFYFIGRCFIDKKYELLGWDGVPVRGESKTILSHNGTAAFLMPKDKACIQTVMSFFTASMRVPDMDD